MRWVKRGIAIGAAPVGLRKPEPNDFCAFCRRLRSAVEGVADD
jgi:molybdenum cofactor biosynthesis enzyme MoaA